MLAVAAERWELRFGGPGRLGRSFGRQVFPARRRRVGLLEPVARLVAERAVDTRLAPPVMGGGELLGEGGFGGFVHCPVRLAGLDLPPPSYQAPRMISSRVKSLA